MRHRVAKCEKDAVKTSLVSSTMCERVVYDTTISRFTHVKLPSLSDIILRKLQFSDFSSNSHYNTYFRPEFNVSAYKVILPYYDFDYQSVGQ